MEITFEQALKKIPTALANLKVPEGQRRMVENYILNLFILIISSEDFRKRLKKDLPKLVEDIIKL